MFPLLLVLALAAAPWGGNPYAEEEDVLSGALTLRAAALEKATGIRFGVPWTHRVTLERLMTGSGFTDGMYDPDTRRVVLSVSIVGDLTVALGKPVRLATAAEVAAQRRFIGIVDHELGHALTDAVSIRTGHGSWFTVQGKPDERLAIGRDVLAEGTARWFEYALSPSDTMYSEESFPSGAHDRRFYRRDLYSYGGGYWLVRDILTGYAERGLLWLIEHPLSLDFYEMRSGAVAYRSRALAELAGPP